MTGRPLLPESSGATILQGHALDQLAEIPDLSVQCCVTSPPYYGLRNYGIDGQIGLEGTPEEYVATLVAVMREVGRVLRDDGTLWLNLGDSYANDTKWGGSSGGKHAAGLHGQSGVGRGRRHTGLKGKDLIGIPWVVAFALRTDGWYLRSEIIWAKPNPLPESVTDRPTKAHEQVFLLTKSATYYYDADAIREPAVVVEQGRTPGPESNGYHVKSGRMDSGAHRGGMGFGVADAGRNKRSVWLVGTQPYPDAHFATFPPRLVEPMILAGSRGGDVVLDPFCGSGTTGAVALALGREFVGIELNASYVDLAKRRCQVTTPLFAA